MRIKKGHRNTDFKQSIVELYGLQHDINMDRNELDELNFEVNKLMNSIKKIEKFKEENFKKQLEIANEYYTESKLNEMISLETDAGKLRILNSILQIVVSNNTHNEITIQQLFEVDPDAVAYISTEESLNVFGKFQMTLNNLNNGERK